ncbi:TadE family type IV pilus minor pilin, partial [Cumulibacter manganitolerans]|uniref:TadE family type IV pilus minor pilin n=1 Tax=Cumulibacter manganitolerans TaxID=1884992 RepID=UPI001885C76E
MTRSGVRGDRGMVTAETALALPALVIVLGGLLTVIVAVSAQLRCVAAAREGARAAARGEPAAVVRQTALR